MRCPMRAHLACPAAGWVGGLITDQPFSLQGMPTMAAVTDKAIVLAVERFFQRPEIRGNLAFLNNRLPGSADIVVAGGAIRNLDPYQKPVAGKSGQTYGSCHHG